MAPATVALELVATEPASATVDIESAPRTSWARLADAIVRRESLGPKRLAVVSVELALVTLSALLILLVALRHGVTFQGDFNGDLYYAGLKILGGTSPYAPHRLAAEAELIRHGGTFSAVAFPRYPAPALVAAVPLSLLSVQRADTAFVVLSMGAVIASLRLLGVRDWRCYVVTCLAWPTAFGVWLGNVSPLLLLGAAVTWRWRDRTWPAAIAVASMIAMKLFMWPLGVWMIITRRLRMAVTTAVIAVVALALGWAAIGFAGLAEYPSMLRNITTIGEGRGSSLVSALIAFGVSTGVARLVALFCAALLLAMAGRMYRLDDRGARAFGLSIMAALVACPVVWAHYLVLLFVPVALLSPRLSWLWFLPMLGGLIPGGPVAQPDLWISLPHLAIDVVIIVNLAIPSLGARVTPVAKGGITRLPVVSTVEQG